MSEETQIIFQPESQPDLPQGRFLDRELSWLEFNQRVLELAEDKSLPLLERVHFLSIFASNLDEFFMVRVASLKRRIATGIAVQSASGGIAANLGSNQRPAVAPCRIVCHRDFPRTQSQRNRCCAVVDPF